jgi:hypothetical protein
VEVVCAWWMMPLVRGKMEGAHRDICRKVVQKVVRDEERAREGAGVKFDVGKGVESPARESLPEKTTYG